MRARNIKPGLFLNEILGQEDPLYTLLFQGLWCMADREGRLEDRPLRIKAEVFPYRDGLDVNGYLTQLERWGFIRRYEASGMKLIEVVNFQKHQSPHHTERASELPANTNGCALTVSSPLGLRGNPPDSLIPDSLIPDSNNPPTPLGGVVGSPVEAKPARKRTPKAERLGGFAPEVVELVRRLMGVWPTQRDGKPMRNDDVAAAANITRLLADHPDVTIAELEDAALGWLSTKPAFPNAIEFWFGRGKGGSMPPWEREVRGLRTRQVSA